MRLKIMVWAMAGIYSSRFHMIASHKLSNRQQRNTNYLPHRFKIQEAGFSNGVWGTDTVINSGGNQQIHIPECIEDGQYLLRAEMVALHGARTTNGAQLYVSAPCLSFGSNMCITNVLLDGVCPDQHYRRKGDEDTNYSEHSWYL